MRYQAALHPAGRKKWQGQKDLNPRHVVLETTALPTELYPYGGEDGIRTHAPVTRPNGLANRPLEPA